MRLDGKTAIVTGGASGIGEATVRRFVQEGAKVAIVDIQSERGRALQSALGASALYFDVDVTSEAAVKALVEHVMSAWGRVDVMFNNAGAVGPLARAEDIPFEGFQRIFGLLVGSVVLGVKYVAPVMKQQRSGVILNTASIAALLNGYGPHLYNGAKAAVVALSRSFAMELGPHNVRVNAICPGGIVTPMAGDKLGGGSQGLATAERLYRNFQPVPRAGSPDDIANTAAWLASDEASFVNAAAIVVDGGAAGGQSWSPMFESEPTEEWIASLNRGADA